MATVRDLQPDMLREIVGKEVCEARRCVAPLVCHGWRKGLGNLSELALPPQLPWLLRPDTAEGAPAFSCLMCDDARASAEIHHLRVPEELCGARYIGSYDGRWLIFSPGCLSGSCVLYSMRSKERQLLPDKAWPSRSQYFYQMDVLAVTLSSTPAEDYLGAAMVRGVPDAESRRVVFWRKGSRVALDPYTYRDGSMVDIEVQDCIYHKGSFFILGQKEGLHLWEVETRNGEVVMKEDHRVLFIPAEEAYQHSEKDDVCRYLVESRGSLLMVIKSGHWKDYSAKDFRMFEMQLNRQDIRYDMAPFHWTEVLELDGRMIFVAKCCSRSYETSQFPGCQDGVYFVDDRQMYQKEDNVPSILRIFKDVTAEDEHDMTKTMDNGRWSAAEGIERCFPPALLKSEQSSSVWVLP